MATVDKWGVATARRDEGELVIRFNYGRAELADDPMYSRAIEVHLVGPETTNVEEYLAGLDLLEDAARGKADEMDGCIMLMSCSGADFRDLLFAYGGSEPQPDCLLEERLEPLSAESGAKTIKPNWGLFRALVNRVAE